MGLHGNKIFDEVTAISPMSSQPAASKAADRATPEGTSPESQAPGQGDQSRRWRIGGSKGSPTDAIAHVPGPPRSWGGAGENGAVAGAAHLSREERIEAAEAEH